MPLRPYWTLYTTVEACDEELRLLQQDLELSQDEYAALAVEISDLQEALAAVRAHRSTLCEPS